MKLNLEEVCAFKTEKEVRTESQGTHGRIVSSDEDITIVWWLYNSIVNLASSFISIAE